MKNLNEYTKQQLIEIILRLEKHVSHSTLQQILREVDWHAADALDEKASTAFDAAIEAREQAAECFSINRIKALQLIVEADKHMNKYYKLQAQADQLRNWE